MGGATVRTGASHCSSERSHFGEAHMYGTRILLIGEDHDALLRRAEVVSTVGHEVEIAIGRHRGILACGARLFDYIFVTAPCDEDADALARDVASNAVTTSAKPKTTPRRMASSFMTFIASATFSDVAPCAGRQACSPGRLRRSPTQIV